MLSKVRFLQGGSTARRLGRWQMEALHAHLVQRCASLRVRVVPRTRASGRKHCDWIPCGARAVSKLYEINTGLHQLERPKTYTSRRRAHGRRWTHALDTWILQPKPRDVHDVCVFVCKRVIRSPGDSQTLNIFAYAFSSTSGFSLRYALMRWIPSRHDDNPLIDGREVRRRMQGRLDVVERERSSGRSHVDRERNASSYSFMVLKT